MAKGLVFSVFFSIALTAVLCASVENYQTIMGVRIYDLDPDCAMLGGLCVKNSDCLEKTTTNGLCPSNHRQGVECCYELAAKDGICRSFGGECVSHFCAAKLQKTATDCTTGTVCCVLI